jgi:hypothetical protein
VCVQRARNAGTQRQCDCGKRQDGSDHRNGSF